MRTSKSNRRKIVKSPRRLPALPRIHFRSLLLPLAAVALVGGTLFGSKILLDNPVRTLIVQGTFQRVSPIQVEAALGSALQHRFLSADITEMRRQVEELDWIQKAEIRRVWPDTLEIRVTEHRAAARWGKAGLLDIDGELFTEDVRYTFPELPQLAGPRGREREVANYYLAVRGLLAEANLQMRSLAMDSRGALWLLLEGGQEIRVGQTGIGERLERFFRVVAPTLAQEFARVSYVDLRYTNGFAVGWSPEAVIPQAAQTHRVTDSG